MRIRLFQLEDGGFFQIIHFNVHKRKQLQYTFLRKKSNRIFNNYTEKLSVSRVHTAAALI